MAKHGELKMNKSGEENLVKSLAQSRIKRSKALELAADGLSYDDIARRVGYSHRGSAHRAVFKALGEYEAQNVEHLRALELARLDALQVAYWDAAMAGDIRAGRTILRILDLRSRICGLYGPAGRAKEPEFRSLVIGPLEGNA